MVSEQVLAVARDLRGTDLKAMGAPTGFVVRQCPVCEAEGYGRVEATVRLRAAGVTRWGPDGFRIPSKTVEQDVCSRHAEALITLLTGGSPSQRRTLHVAAERDMESMAHDVMTPGITPFPVHHLLVSAHWAPDPDVEFWAQVAGIWTDADGRFGHQLGLRTDTDSELQHHVVTTLDAEGVDACARGVVAAGRGTGRFRQLAHDSDLTGYVHSVADALEGQPPAADVARVGVGLFCVQPSSCFEDHGREG